MNDTKRQRILDKIRKLQRKTTTLGCTEAEALAAAQAVGRLLDEYGLTMSDVELQTTTCVEDAVLSPFASNRHPIRYCLRALSGYCHTAYFFRQQRIDDDRTRWRTAYHFFGLPHDVEVAVYLTQVILAALERESASFKRTPAYRQLASGGKREALKSFRYGMAQRISARLDEMKAARERDLQATGRELVQVVGAVVSRAFTQAYPDLRTVRYHERPYDATAFDHGKAAGGRVGLHPGVKSGAAPLQLGT
jgi:hypothetical protein